MKRFIELLFLSAILLSCSEIEDAQDPVFFEYENTIYNTSFYSLGATDTPQVNWNGKKGFFRLKTSEKTISNFTIDSLSGVVSWNQFLPLGIHTVDIEASNDISFTTISLQISNQFRGRFQGGLSSDLEPESFPNKSYVEFNSDNKFIIESAFQTTGTGIWWLHEDETLKITYTNSKTKQKISLFTRDIISEEFEAYIAGFWIEGEFPDQQDLDGLIEGSFKFRLVSK